MCSGIEAASVAWNPLGWEAAWFSEIEPFPCAVLAHRYPAVRNVGDMRDLPTLIELGMVEAPELLVGGTPCQAFSVAGLREGLADPRGGLSLSFVAIANATDKSRERWKARKRHLLGERPRSPHGQRQRFRLLPCCACRRRHAARAGRGQVDGRRCCVWTRTGNRVAGPRRPIFRRGPTPSSSVRCRKCSIGLRSKCSFI